MASSPGTASSPVRRPAADVIEAVLENMRRNLEPLRYSVLAPSRYVVYLHPDEMARLEGIIPLLREQTERALSETLTGMNGASVLRRSMNRVLGRRPLQVENAAGHWHVEFLADADGELAVGDLLVDSELILPARPELGVGERTRRMTTVHLATGGGPPRVTTLARTPSLEAGPLPLPPLPEVPGPAVVARLVYEDRSGRHTFDVVKDSVTIGRGGTIYPVDVRVVSSADVSREHARIRRDPASGRFFLIDLSSLGTSLNGHPVARGYDEVDGSKRENGTETPLLDGGRVGLSEIVFLDFRIVA